MGSSQLHILNTHNYFCSTTFDNIPNLINDGLPPASPWLALLCRRSSNRPCARPGLPPFRPPRLPLRDPCLASHHESSPWEVWGFKRLGGAENICLRSSIFSNQDQF